VGEVSKKIYKALLDYKVDSDKEKFQMMVNPLSFGNSPIGFFYGASSRENSGIGVLIKLDTTHCYKAHMFIGGGTNI